MQKGQVIQGFIQYFENELAVLARSAKTAHEAATHEESQAEDRHDTFAIESSYLAAGQAARALEIDQTILEYRSYLENAVFSKQVALGTLVCLQAGERMTQSFIAIRGGGSQIRIGGETITVITPESPLGDALLDGKPGDEITVETRNGSRDYTVISID